MSSDDARLVRQPELMLKPYDMAADMEEHHRTMDRLMQPIVVVGPHEINKSEDEPRGWWDRGWLLSRRRLAWLVVGIGVAWQLVGIAWYHWMM
jgi:hypothetical protein